MNPPDTPVPDTPVTRPLVALMLSIEDLDALIKMAGFGHGAFSEGDHSGPMHTDDELARMAKVLGQLRAYRDDAKERNG